MCSHGALRPGSAGTPAGSPASLPRPPPPGPRRSRRFNVLQPTASAFSRHPRTSSPTHPTHTSPPLCTLSLLRASPPWERRHPCRLPSGSCPTSLNPPLHSPAVGHVPPPTRRWPHLRLTANPHTSASPPPVSRCSPPTEIGFVPDPDCGSDDALGSKCLQLSGPLEIESRS